MKHPALRVFNTLGRNNECRQSPAVLLCSGLLTWIQQQALSFKSHVVKRAPESTLCSPSPASSDKHEAPNSRSMPSMMPRPVHALMESRIGLPG
jgi:hypothetical protein